MGLPGSRISERSRLEPRRTVAAARQLSEWKACAYEFLPVAAWRNTASRWNTRYCF